jgi:acyl-CoA synthetase (AMP-forming)/AMP-acid ligase II
MSDTSNIAATLKATAERFPDQRAILVPTRRDRSGQVTYTQLTFRELDELSNRLADGFRALGIVAGTRIVLMVRPGIEFIALAYGLFRAGAVVVLIDPGMGPRRVFRCLEQVNPQGFVAVPIVQAMRVLSAGRFPNASFNVTVGRRWFWRGATYDALRRSRNPGGADLPRTGAS